MDWIKQHYDRFILLLFGLGLIASSVVLFGKTREFPKRFDPVLAKVEPGTAFKPAEVTTLENAIAHIDKPTLWQSHAGSLLVSRKYLVQDGKLVDPLEGGGITIHPPVPNEWLLEHNLDLLDSNILNEDPDGDGFTVLDEFNAKTDPQDKASRPPYWTKLRLKQALLRRFRLKFAAYVDDSFQINTLDLRQPSQFLKLGETIGGTKFKLLSFEKKTVTNENTGSEQDISELTVQNEETQENVVLILNRIVDSPDSFADLVLLWDGSQYRVKKDQTFALKVEPDVEYKLIDIRPNQAVITNLKTNERITVPRLEGAQ
ncbi:MAG TPA: Amuc_1099 family pilus-like system protein [Chthoniobacteraceae bacterium]|nr:Amuc_1099 family pilus-like system protein [Chthoniobacteraceae bacterium]